MIEMISAQELNEICHAPHTKLINLTGAQKPKVLETPDTIIKLFYPRKKYFSRLLKKSHGKQFYHNAIALQKKAVDGPDIIKMHYCIELKTHIIQYKKIAGNDLRYLAQQGQSHIIQKIAPFIAELHQKGIFFRAIHLGNIIYKNDHTFALIDIEDLKCYRKPLNLHLRYRNLKHLFTIRTDKITWKNFGIEKFLNLYLQETRLSFVARKILRYITSSVILN